MAFPDLGAILAGATRIASTPAQRRHLVRWLWSLRPGYLERSRLPWLTFDAIEWLNARLWRDKRVFEFGAGASTLYWQRSGAHCTSVEHDRGWFERVRSLVGGTAQIDLRWIPPEPVRDSTAQLDPAFPTDYVSSDPAFCGLAFRRYASSIDELRDGTVDLVLVDGRARPSCVMHAIPKLAADGVLVLDNTDRPHYLQHTRSILAGFTELRFGGATPAATDPSMTSIFVKM